MLSLPVDWVEAEVGWLLEQASHAHGPDIWGVWKAVTCCVAILRGGYQAEPAGVCAAAAAAIARLPGRRSCEAGWGGASNVERLCCYAGALERVCLALNRFQNCWRAASCPTRWSARWVQW
jgi:hypothetical protein